MSNSAVYIPTKQRTEFAIKAAVILDADIPVYIVSERQHQSDIIAALKKIPRAPVEPVFLKGRDRGVGYARNAVIQHADMYGYESIAMIDDDQLVSGDVSGWLEAATREDVTGIGAYKSIYGLLCGKTEITRSYREPGVWLTKGSVGHQAIAVNVANVLGLDNYDASLREFEDHEICRAAYEEYGAPWFIYTGVFSKDQITRKNAHLVGGGIHSVGDKFDFYHEQSHRVVHERWPEYVSAPGSRYRCAWKRLVTDFTSLEAWPLEDVRSEAPWDWAGPET
jgi:hypothetical protein